jgi:hypothetical protein
MRIFIINIAVFARSGRSFLPRVDMDLMPGDNGFMDR